MRSILPLVLLTVTACYTPRAVNTAGPYDDDVYAGVAPLEATVYYDEFSGYARFDVSRSAHVAVFAMRPGAGMEMIYPEFGYRDRNEFTSGRHYVRTSRWSAGMARQGRGSSLYHDDGPMYVLLVASDDPLDLRQFRSSYSVSWLSRSAITYNPYVALEALVGDLVPYPSMSAWTTAVHVVWPSQRQRGGSDRYISVRCASGITVVVPVDALVLGYPVCPEHMEERPEQPGDSVPKIRAAVTPQKGTPPDGWMARKIGGVDLREELRRVRQLHGKRDPGELEVRPFPAMPAERARGTEYGSGSAGAWERERRRAEEARARARDTGEARPAPARPAPQARPQPSRPAPVRPSRPAPTPKPRPAPAPKPKPSSGGNNGGNGGSGNVV